MAIDWIAWHRRYETEAPFRRRLELVERHVAEAIGAARSEPVRIIDVCAGDGRALLDVLVAHPRRARVRARIVELDARLAATARERARALRLTGVEVIEADAGFGRVYEGALPADLVLLCGVLGHVTVPGIERLIGLLPTLCAPGAKVIWTRHRRPPDLTPAIRGWFAAAGFEEVGVEPIGDSFATVGVAGLVGLTPPFDPSARLFAFVDAP